MGINKLRSKLIFSTALIAAAFVSSEAFAMDVSSCDNVGSNRSCPYIQQNSILNGSTGIHYCCPGTASLFPKAPAAPAPAPAPAPRAAKAAPAPAAAPAVPAPANSTCSANGVTLIPGSSFNCGTQGASGTAGGAAGGTAGGAAGSAAPGTPGTLGPNGYVPDPNLSAQANAAKAAALSSAANPSNYAVYGSTETIANGPLAGTQGTDINLNNTPVNGQIVGSSAPVVAGVTQNGTTFVEGSNRTLMSYTDPSTGNTSFYAIPDKGYDIQQPGNFPPSDPSMACSSSCQLGGQPGNVVTATVTGNGTSGATASVGAPTSTTQLVVTPGSSGTTSSISYGNNNPLTQPSSNTANGGGAGGNGLNGTQPDGKVAVQEKDLNDASDVGDKSDKDCAVSSGVFAMSCRNTRTLLTTSQATTLGAQMAGSTALNVAGGMQQQNMMQNGATQAQAYQAQASLQMKAAMLQTTVGAGQLVFGYLEQKAGTKHGDQADTLDAATHQHAYSAQGEASVLGGTQANIVDVSVAKAKQGKNGSSPVASDQVAVAQRALNATAGNNTADFRVYKETTQASAVMIKNATSIAGKAQIEQKNMQDQASGASLGDYLKGAQTTAAGLLAMAAAKQAEELANRLNNASPVPLPSGADAFNENPEVPRMPTVIGAGDTSASNTPTVAAATGPGSTLGTGIGTLGGSGSDNPAPAPGAFAAGAPADGGGSGGGAGGGSGGTSTTAAAPGSADDPQAKYAASNNGGATYQGGGSALGGNGGGRGGSDPSIALKDAFAQMMGQNGDGAGKGADGVDIMNYRNLASDSNYTPLSRGDDIFKHFHETYEGLQKKGRIGQ